MLLRSATETLARKTTRRGLFGRGAEVAFGALLGVAAGSALRAGRAMAGVAGTACVFPGHQPCPCEGCQPNGVCAKPCIVFTGIYASGCWITAGANGNVTCCDCDCNGNVPGSSVDVCGCGSDYHNDPAYCP
jgi:hypothetical protein